MDESEKTLKIDFPPRRMSRKLQKQHFRRGRKTKNGENCISAMAESLKMEKNAFRPRPKSKKQQKKHFGRGRN